MVIRKGGDNHVGCTAVAATSCREARPAPFDGRGGVALSKHDLIVSTGELRGMPVIRAVGELDLSNVTEVRSVVAEECERRPSVLIFDLRDLTYMDSSGLGVLVGAKRRLAAHE